MPRMIFVNLPVADVDRARAFYETLGGVRDPRFCEEGSTEMLFFSETISVMLLSHARYADFTAKRIVDARTENEVLVCFSEESRNAVDATADRAIAAGGRPDPTPRQDLGFMYGRSVEDPDGHIVELVWMDVEAATAGSAAPASDAVAA